MNWNRVYQQLQEEKQYIQKELEEEIRALQNMVKYEFQRIESQLQQQTMQYQKNTRNQVQGLEEELKRCQDSERYYYRKMMEYKQELERHIGPMSPELHPPLSSSDGYSPTQPVWSPLTDNMYKSNDTNMSPITMNVTRQLIACDGCGNPARGECGHCGVAKYCDPECQTTHWHAVHSEFCVPPEFHISQDILDMYNYDSRDAFIRAAQNGEIENIDAGFKDWVRKQGLIAKFWVKMRTSRGRSNLLRDIGAGKYDDDTASLDAIVKAASKSRKFSDLKLMAERRLGRLEGSGQ